MNPEPDTPTKRTSFRNSSRLKHITKLTLLIAVIVFALDLSAIAAFSLIRLPVSQVDAVIVLGAKVGTPALTERALQGLKYYREGKTDTIVLSGGRGAGEPISEAEAMQHVIAQSVTAAGGTMPTMMLDSTSLNTFENIRNAKALVPRAKSVVIVSDGFHLARSVALAHRAGLPNVYWDAPKPSYYPPFDLVFYYLREAIAMLAYLPKFVTN